MKKASKKERSKFILWTVAGIASFFFGLGIGVGLSTFFSGLFVQVLGIVLVVGGIFAIWNARSVVNRVKDRNKIKDFYKEDMSIDGKV